MKLPTHSRSPAASSRPGFTLVELMVVIAIIGVVVTLGASATMQVITRQRAANTEWTIRKVNEALKAHWKAVVDQAKIEPIPDSAWQGLLAMAGADGDAARRARIIWIKLRLKQQFPMNFMEALVPTPKAGSPYVLLPPAPAFVQALVGVPTLPWPVGQIPPSNSVAKPVPGAYESSVCLLLAISQARKGAPAFDQDRFTSSELADVNGLKAIVDAWGRPLVFSRWPIGGEIAASNPNSPNVRSGSTLTGDPLDPDALLTNPNTWNMQANYNGRLGVWAFEKLFHPVHDVDVGGYKPKAYYSVPVVASAGPVIGSLDTVYTLMGLPQPQELQSPLAQLPVALLHDPMKMAPGNTPVNLPIPPPILFDTSFDNIYSFRMRFGARGD